MLKPRKLRVGSWSFRVDDSSKKRAGVSIATGDWSEPPMLDLPTEDAHRVAAWFQDYTRWVEFSKRDKLNLEKP